MKTKNFWGVFKDYKNITRSNPDIDVSAYDCLASAFIYSTHAAALDELVRIYEQFFRGIEGIQWYDDDEFGYKVHNNFDEEIEIKFRVGLIMLEK